MRSKIVRWEEDEVDFNRFFQYNEISPSCLVWKPRPVSDFKTKSAYESFHSNLLGEVAGCMDERNGYKRWRVSVNHIKYPVSRVVYMMKVGPIPPNMQIDHIDLNPTNNRISNLRLATHGQNQANTKPFGKLGVKGVYKYGDKYKSYISNGEGGLLYIGTFDTIEQAREEHEWYVNSIHGEFARV